MLVGVLVYRVLGAAWLVPFALLDGLLLVLGSEILAKALGTMYAQGLAPWLALLLEPLLWGLNLVGRLNARFGKPAPDYDNGSKDAASLQEVSALLRLASLNAWRQTDQDRVFSRARELSGLKVKLFVKWILSGTSRFRDRIWGSPATSFISDGF